MSGTFYSKLNRLGMWSGLIVMTILLLGRFWWPGDSTSWSASMRIALAPVLIVLLLQLYWERPLLSPVRLVFALFIGYLLLNAWWVADSSQAIRRILIIAVFTCAVCMVGVRDISWERLLAWVVAVGAMLAVFSMGHHLIKGSFPFGYREGGLVDSGVVGVADFGNTIVAGMHYAFCFLFAFWLALSAKTRRAALMWWGCLIVLAIYIYFTYARTSWVASALGAGVLVMLLAGSRVRQGIYIACAVLAVCVVVLGWQALSYEFTVRGLSFRDEIWLEVLSRMDGDWLFGHGAGVGVGEIFISNGMYTVHNTHCLYLEVLYQFGAIGLALMLVTMMSCGYFLYLRRSNRLACLWLAMLVAVAVVMLVELNSFASTPNLVWIWFWLPISGAVAMAGTERVAHVAH